MAAKNLVIVESPAKAKTIERYLGKDYKVLASYGHVRDLPRSTFAVEVDNGSCHIEYEVPASSKKHVTALKKAAKEAEVVWLAPDLDREGEAIAWHVAEILGLDSAETKRVTFDEITEDAIKAAFADPHTLNLNLVDAQQARRAVDRIVGYRLSPVLWRTVSSGISAGRVQSVALRLIVDREDEIRGFVPREYWSIHGDFVRLSNGGDAVAARLHMVGDRRVATPRDLIDAEADEHALDRLLLIDTEAASNVLVERATGKTFRVAEVRRTENKRKPHAPFITSTLQQEAARKLGFAAKHTMRIAQQLYEGMALGPEGPTGLITYMRTDSVNLAASALKEIAGVVAERYGDKYSIDKPRNYQTKAKRAQEAHEAIRPTSATRHPDDVKQHLDKDQRALYELIWKRTVATQMADAVFDRVSADLVSGEGDDALMFRVTGQVLKFDGFLKLYEEGHDESRDEEEDVEARLPDLTEGEEYRADEVRGEQHFTQPPPRYTESSLVKELEADGIGRPSTYASILSTLRDREYVRVESRRFFPTDLGEVVATFLRAHFAEVVDVGFTARMEETLDGIAEGETTWCATVGAFLTEVDTWVKERKPERPRLPLSEEAECPTCGSPMEKVWSGKSKQWFASCSKWPDCDGTLPLNEDGTVGEPEPPPEPDERVRCPVCDKAMVLREGRFGKFYGCVDYPTCKGIINVAARTPFRCPKDGGHVSMRRSRYGKPFAGCENYPDCDFAIWAVPLAQPCPTCGAPLKPPPKNRKVPVAVCSNPDDPHSLELDDFDVPRVETIEVVPGVPGLDPDAGEAPNGTLGSD